jgi:hypothetical protein
VAKHIGHFTQGVHLGGRICHSNELRTTLFLATWQKGQFCLQLVILPYNARIRPSVRPCVCVCVRRKTPSWYMRAVQPTLVGGVCGPGAWVVGVVPPTEEKIHRFFSSFLHCTECKGGGDQFRWPKAT